MIHSNNIKHEKKWKNSQNEDAKQLMQICNVVLGETLKLLGRGETGRQIRSRRRRVINDDDDDDDDDNSDRKKKNLLFFAQLYNGLYELSKILLLQLLILCIARKALSSLHIVTKK